MYKEHGVFITPNDEVKVWRYMDFTKFVSILETNTLFFPSAASFDDPFEGSISKKTRASLIEDIPENSEQIAKLMSKLYVDSRNRTFINCWHKSDYESEAMWKLYVRNNEGVAIQSTIKNIKSSIIYPKNVYIGEVSYIDYENDHMVGTGYFNLFHLYLNKRISFSHEKEVRLIVGDDIESKGSYGINVDIVLGDLIQSIRVAPSAPAWFFDLVESVVKRYGYNFPISKSDIQREPLF